MAPKRRIVRDWRDLGLALRDLRVLRGLSQKALAQLLGRNQAGICHTETAQSYPHLSVIARWAALCGYQLRIVFEKKGVKA